MCVCFVVFDNGNYYKGCARNVCWRGVVRAPNLFCLRGDATWDGPRPAVEGVVGIEWHRPQHCGAFSIRLVGCNQETAKRSVSPPPPPPSQVLQLVWWCNFHRHLGVFSCNTGLQRENCHHELRRQTTLTRAPSRSVLSRLAGTASMGCLLGVSGAAWRGCLAPTPWNGYVRWSNSSCCCIFVPDLFLLSLINGGKRTLFCRTVMWSPSCTCCFVFLINLLCFGGWVLGKSRCCVVWL